MNLAQMRTLLPLVEQDAVEFLVITEQEPVLDSLTPFVWISRNGPRTHRHVVIDALGVVQREYSTLCS